MGGKNTALVTGVLVWNRQGNYQTAVERGFSVFGTVRRPGEAERRPGLTYLIGARSIRVRVGASDIAFRVRKARPAAVVPID